jgi:hypothetical protein
LNADDTKLLTAALAFLAALPAFFSKLLDFYATRSQKPAGRLSSPRKRRTKKSARTLRRRIGF